MDFRVPNPLPGFCAPGEWFSEFPNPLPGFCSPDFATPWIGISPSPKSVARILPLSRFWLVADHCYRENRRRHRHHLHPRLLSLNIINIIIIIIVLIIIGSRWLKLAQVRHILLSFHGVLLDRVQIREPMLAATVPVYASERRTTGTEMRRSVEVPRSRGNTRVPSAGHAEKPERVQREALGAPSCRDRARDARTCFRFYKPAPSADLYVAPAPAATYAAPSPVTVYVEPAASYTAPAPLNENVAPAPAVSYAAPAPIIEYAALEPAVTYTAPAPVNEDMAPAPAVSYAAPVPVFEYVEPAVTHKAAPMIENVAPAPAVSYAAPSPVIEYAEHAVTNTAPAPLNENVAPAPAVSCAAPAPRVNSWLQHLPSPLTRRSRLALTGSWLYATVSAAACYLGSWILMQCTPAIAPSSVHSQDLLPICRWEGFWEERRGGPAQLAPSGLGSTAWKPPAPTQKPCHLSALRPTHGAVTDNVGHTKKSSSSSSASDRPTDVDKKRCSGSRCRRGLVIFTFYILLFIHFYFSLTLLEFTCSIGLIDFRYLM